MSRLMEQAIEKVLELPDSDQDALASILMLEIEAERRWDKLFSRPESADLLSRMAEAALAGATGVSAMAGCWYRLRSTQATSSQSQNT